MIDFRHMDCMDLMKGYPDKHFDLAIVDPPYGIGAAKKQYSSIPSEKYKNPKKIIYNKKWDDQTPDRQYFIELMRASQQQIIWGANHFGNMPSSSCWLAWDKENDGVSDQSDFELAWTSFETGARIFRHMWSGFRKKEPETKIHPTQKPVALYKWLLKNYAKEGNKILDTHCGSGSILIACHDYKFDITACELDKDYFEAASKRLKNHQAQLSFL